MTTLQQHLREADPIALEGPLSQDEILRLRSAVLAAAHEALVTRVPWFALAATSLAVAAGVFVTRTDAVREARVDRLPLAGNASMAASPRQLQFATPGGTRVIWMFNPEFDVRTAQ
jgi:hypothetical protein